MSLPQLEVKMMEPRRNNNTTTSVKRSQTLILVEDRDDGMFVHLTLTVVVKVSLDNGHEGVKQPRGGNYHQHVGVKTKL